MRSLIPAPHTNPGVRISNPNEKSGYVPRINAGPSVFVMVELWTL